ncbi:MAG: AbrB/MazE/SpoVT family DNA-binding domain-containing protein [Candidatus Micrarchaeota archaeon]|nr:AbrB/MazE/SpoVT family DNA-binding domain-containing protein [Candidatus Micrarchaeota archaeon]
MTLIEVKTVKITLKGQISIPRDMREMEGFEEGEKIAILAYDDHIELRPMKSLKKLMKGSVATAILSEKSLAKDWDTKEEDVAWKNL